MSKLPRISHFDFSKGASMKPKKIAYLGISVALALVLSFVEARLAFFIPIYGAYGIKVGLANLVIVFILYKTSIGEAAAVSIVRVALSSLLFGNLQIFVFSLAGAILSIAGMWLMKKFTEFSYITVSVVGAILHNLGQIAVAVLWTQTKEIALYFPILLITGTAAGVVIGLISGMLLKRLEKLKM